MDDEFTNVLIRMPVELKGRLQREAFVNGRKLTGEVNMRLEKSLEQADPETAFAPSPLATVIHTNDKSPASALSDTDRAMLAVFHSLPVQKQLALLSLFQ